MGVPSLALAQAAPAAGRFTLLQIGRQQSQEYVARPVLVAVALGAGIEPHTTGLRRDDPLAAVPLRSPVAFSVGGQALWRGLVGPALGLYASQGSQIEAGQTPAGLQRPSLGDRVSVVAAVAVRPLAWVAWRRRSDWVGRLAAGVGVELGGGLEVTRTSLNLALAPGFHGLLSGEIPVWGGGSKGGLSLRVSTRLLVTRLQCFSPDATAKDQCLDLNPRDQSVTVFHKRAAQILLGLVYYL